MDRDEYRSKQTEKQTAGAGGAVVGLGVVNAIADAKWQVNGAELAQDNLSQTLAQMQLQAAADMVAGLPGGSGPLYVLGGGLIAAGLGHRKWRNSDAYRVRRMLRASSGWASPRDLRRSSGVIAARKQAGDTRPGISRLDRWRKPAREFGAVLGTTISGTRTVRGRRIMTNWQNGMLVFGEPGRWKSGLLGHTVIDFPGPMCVVSTKAEFWTNMAALHLDSGRPVMLCDPHGTDQTCPPECRFRWDMVAGCRDATVAQRRATVLMAAASGEGLQNADFWAGKGRSLFTSLLVAADLDGVTLREVAGWLHAGDYSRPLKVLEHYAGQIESSVLTSLRHYAEGKAEVTASSAAHTAAQVVEFLQNPQLAEALCPPRGTGTDMESFLAEGGVLYLVTNGDKTLAPMVNALVEHVTTSLKQRVNREKLKRHDPPLGLIIDEADKTLPSVPLHTMAAELRGWGVWMAIATQNYSQLETTWGATEAKTMATSLQTTVITAAHGQPDREEHSRRIGTRRVEHVSHAENGAAADTQKSLFNTGHSLSTQYQDHDIPTFPPQAFGDLVNGQAVVIPNQGKPSVVKFEHSFGRAKALVNKLQTRQAVERQAEAEAEAQRQAALEAAAESETGAAGAGGESQ